MATKSLGKVVIARNFFVLKKKKIYKKYPVYVSKHNLNLQKQVIFLMVPSGEGQHYLLMKKLSALLRVTTSKHVFDFYCFNFLHSFITKKGTEKFMQILDFKLNIDRYKSSPEKIG